VWPGWFNAVSHTLTFRALDAKRLPSGSRFLPLVRLIGEYPPSAVRVSGLYTGAELTKVPKQWTNPTPLSHHDPVNPATALTGWLRA